MLLRPATLDDCRLVWEWANDPLTRAASFSTAAIPWDDHVAWFERQLADPAIRFYIAVEGVPVGQLRYQLAGGEATVSIAVARALRGRSHATHALVAGAALIFREVAIVHAYIKRDNETSRRLFLRAGFVDATETNAAWHLVQRAP